ncbi:MAG TPA: lysylphosphatidylglycerol synthase domain-containing protein [Streptosporangiaceae bacterium]|nr:lysylphosphatidylglycerol synthase domain-containing protein [Streptosporangiaceae bacterium]
MTVPAPTTPACPETAPEPPGARRARPSRRLLAGVLSILVIGGVFGFALPRFASYGAVWGSLQAMSLPWLGVIAAAVVASLVTTWMMVAAVLPSLRLRDAATVNLGSSAVANTVPGGGAVAMGVSWAMLSSWGVATSEYIRYTLVSGLWNVFVRLGLPVVALSVLVLTGRSGTASQAAAYAGAGVLVLLAVVFRATLRSESFARLADRALARVLTAGCRLARRPPPRQAGGLLLEFRAGAAGLLARRGLRITATTVASHLTLWLVLLACLRADRLTQAQVSWQASLAAFAFVRLLSVLPITPGGVGVVEVGLTAPLIEGLAPAEAAKVAAAVLLFRTVTYLLPIPLGALAFLGWRHMHRRRHPITRSSPGPSQAPDPHVTDKTPRCRHGVASLGRE